MKPNLFDFATSELSQDAFICWLLSWADPKFEATDGTLHRLSMEFVEKLLEICDVPIPPRIASVEVHRQHRSIDILAIVNGQIAILIEDKTGTVHHSNQLERYRNTIATDFPQHSLAAIYFKTGDQCSYEDVRQAGYACFLRKDLLQVLEKGRAAGIQNHIFSDFCEYLSKIETRISDYRRLPATSGSGLALGLLEGIFHRPEGASWRRYVGLCSKSERRVHGLLVALEGKEVPSA
jgi:hypothetical protein